MQDPGDFGRRVATRREELGLDLSQLAARTGMAESYLRHLETAPDARPDLRAVAKLANGLEVTTGYLLGTGASRPPGRGRGERNARIAVLDEEESWSLLAAGGVGRLVFEGERGPTAEPVNFAVLAPRAVVFRSEEESHLTRLAGAEPIGFEVDRLDEAMRTGWSVFLTGRLRRATDPGELERLAALHIQPWAGGRRSAYLVLDVEETTGRRIEVQG